MPADSGPKASDGGWGDKSYLGVSNAAVVKAAGTWSNEPLTDAPAANQFIRLTDLFVQSDTACVLTITEETSGRIIAKINLAANSNYNWIPRGRVQTAVAGKRLLITSSASGTMSATPLYSLTTIGN